MEKETTLENFNGKLTNDRRDGNSTRIIDHAVQIIFNQKICVVQDHWQNGRHDEANKDLFRRILDRCYREHRYLFNEKKLEFSTLKLEIWLNLDLEK
jgi:hypothetical protein